MVVLCTAICTKIGKPLVSRQFVEMTRIRIEGLLAAFPKLLGSDAKQHTFVETESVRYAWSVYLWNPFHICFAMTSFFFLLFSLFVLCRYVYQPMDNLYLLLITNRASNIVEDLETLRLLSKGDY